MSSYAVAVPRKIPAGAIDISRAWCWSGGILLGALGFLGNLAAIPLAFGIEFIMGGTLAMMALRLFGAGPGIGAALISSAATYVLWGHPYAIAAYTLEIAFIAWLEDRKGIPAAMGAVIYWVALGGPLLFLAYDGLLDMSRMAAQTIILKQAINGLVQITVAEGLVLILSKIPGVWARRLTPVAIRDVLFIGLIFFGSLPAIAMVVQGARHHLGEVVGNSQRLLTLSLDEVSEQIRKYRDKMISDLTRVEGDNQLLRSLMVSRRISAVRYGSPGEDGGAEVSLGESPSDAIHLVRDYRFIDKSLNERTLDVWVRSGPITAVMEDPVARELGTLELWQNGQRVVFSTVGKGRSVPLSEPVRQARVADTTVMVPRLDGKAKLQRWVASYLVAQTGIAGKAGLVLHGTFPLAGAIARHHAILLEKLAVTLFILLLVPLVAFSVSGQATKGLQALISRFRALPADNFLKSPPSLQHSEIQEFRTLAAEFDTMAQSLRYQHEEARLYRRRLDQLMAQSPGLLYALGIENGVPAGATYVSPASVRLIGYTPEECAAPNWWIDNVHPEDRATVLLAHERLMENGEVQHSYRFRHKDGHYIWLHDDVHLVCSENGEAEAFGFWADYTAQREAEAKVAHTAKMADLGQMATGMAHELNQPLNIIDLAVANLASRMEKGTCDPGYMRDKVARVRQQVARASDIIDHMRIFGRIDSGVSEPFEPAASVNSVALLLGHQLALDDIELDVRDESDGARVLGRAGPLEQVLFNLVTNARQQILKHNADEGFSKGQRRDWIRIHLSRSQDGKYVKIDVLDSGGGVPPDVISKVFEPFMTTKPVGEGTGLGLSVAYGIIHDMHGEIAVCNEAEGAHFSISLPQLKGEAGEV